MFFDDTVADAEAQTRAFADGFRSVERVENFLRVLDARAAVVELDPDAVVASEGANFQDAFVLGFQHGIESIVDDVQENLFDLMRVCNHGGDGFVDLALDADVVDSEIVVA